MTMQIVGGVLVCAATTLLGVHMGNQGSMRAKDLMEFKKTLLMLKSQIDYCIYTLPQAFMHISERTSPPFSEFYEDIAKKLDEGQMDAPTAWEEGLDALKASNLTKDDLANIAMLGTSLGNMDAKVQINSIDMLLTGIDENLNALLKENPKNMKMFRGLGVVSGLLITIVLL